MLTVLLATKCVGRVARIMEFHSTGLNSEPVFLCTRKDVLVNDLRPGTLQAFLASVGMSVVLPPSPPT
jgi:hypothetical protein